MKGICIFLADGFEDMEAIATRDVLKRGGIDVKTVALGSSRSVQSSHGLTVQADFTRSEFEGTATEGGEDRMDVMIFPGGMPGSRTLASDQALIGMMKRHYAAGGTVAAICAAPGLVASRLDGLEGKRFTCYEGFQDGMLAKGAVYTREGVVTDGRLITGRSAGYAVEFGLTVLEYLAGPETCRKVRLSL